MKIFSVTALLAVLVGCSWSGQPDDAGDEAWVRQAVPTILGRRAHGTEEVRVLVDMVDAVGREAVAEALLDEPEMVDYWSQVLVDKLQVARGGGQRVASGCYDAPLLHNPRVGRQLVDHLTYADPLDPFCPDGSHREAGPTDPARDGSDPRDQRDPGGDGTLADAKPPPGAPYVPEGQDFYVYPGGSPRPAAEHASTVWVDDITQEAAVTPATVASPEDVTGCKPFNMTDVIRNGVAYDNLFAIYRAYLFPMTNFSAVSDMTAESNIKEPTGARWMDVFLNRDTMCTECHTTSFSTTDARPRNDNWDRFYPTAWDLEGAAFAYRDSNHWFYGGNGDDVKRRHVVNFFRSDQHAPENDPGAVMPLGFDASCVTNHDARWGGFRAAVSPRPTEDDHAAVAGMAVSDRYSVFDLANAYRDALPTFQSATASPPNWLTGPGWTPGPGSNPAGDWALCMSCHGGGNPMAPSLPPILARISNEKLFHVMMNGSAAGLMPALPAYTNGAFTEARAIDLLAWIRQQPFAFNPAPIPDDNRHALLALLATSIANDVVAEVQGRGLVVLHGFARNPDQLSALNELSATIAARWSLRDVLKTIVLSDAFNRRAPSDSGLAYVMPMITNPWAAVSPAEPNPPVGADADSVGDDVHRFSIPNLLNSLHGALGWARPGLGIHPFPWSTTSPRNGWPDHVAQRDLGRYTSATEPGLEDVDFASLLAWEDVIDACRRPNGVKADDVHVLSGMTPQADGIVWEWQYEDWIDVLAREADAQQVTLEAAVVALKDRLWNDPRIDATERTMMQMMFHGLPLNTPFVAASHEDELRQLCGVLVKAPQFMLGGLSPEHAMPASPIQLSVCFPDEPCGYRDICLGYSSALAAHGYTFPCPGGPSGGPGAADTF